MVAEQADDLLGLAEPQQAVIDEDAGELVADGLVDQHRGDRAESTPPDRPQMTRPLPTCARILAIISPTEGGHRPVAGAGRRCLCTKLRDQLGAVAACARPRGGTCTA